MIIRTATTGDLQAILDIYNHAVINTTATADYEPQSLESRAAWMQDRQRRGFPVLVAEFGDHSILGWASLSPYHSRIGYSHTAENSIYVSPAHQREGVGKALLAELLNIAAEIDLHAIVAVIDGDNAASVRLHAAYGFEHCGRFPEVVRKFDRWLDIVYMVKIIDPRSP